MACQNEGQDGEESDDERCTALKRWCGLGEAFLEVRLIHGHALCVKHKNQQVILWLRIGLLQHQNSGTDRGEGSKEEGRSEGRLSWE